MPPSTHAYGIDTSVFVRLLTGHPDKEFAKTAAALKRLHDAEPATEIFVSNQVIGEAYITLQFFYEIPKADAREAILFLFENGNLAPLNGRPVIDLLREPGGPGLMDRLISQDYGHRHVRILTNDRKMSKLSGVELLK